MGEYSAEAGGEVECHLRDRALVTLVRATRRVMRKEMIQCRKYSDDY